MIYTTIDNFYVTDEQLEASPSRKDGISREVETQLRIYSCEIIQEGGILLRLPQAVMATGQVLLHRFYCKESMLKFNVKRVAWACCWLATKLEETPRRLRDMLSVFVRIDKRRGGKPLVPLDFYSKEYAVRKQELIDVERHLLRTFGFVLHVDHPHKFVLNYLNIILKADQALKQEAWNLANDSLRTTLSVRFKADTVACGIIFLAARRLKIPLPEQPPWWELFGVGKADMYTVAREVNALYGMPKVEYISVYRSKQQSPQGGGGGRDTTPIVSPARMQGTPGASGQDSEPDAGERRIRSGQEGPGSGGSADRVSRDTMDDPDGGDDARQQGGSEPTRARHKRDRADGTDSERRKKHRGGEDGAHLSDKDERGSKRDKEGDRKRDKRDKEAARSRDGRAREKRRSGEAEREEPRRERGLSR